MDYSSYFAPPALASTYPLFDLQGKPDQSYTPQEDPQSNPLVSTEHRLSQSQLPRDDQPWLPPHQDVYNDPSAFEFFDQGASFTAAPIISSETAFDSIYRPSISNALPYNSSGSISNGTPGDGDFDQSARAGSSDEDKDNLTPAQSKRKAQNRSAQRAFRDRKERHVKDLELKLKSTEARTSSLVSDNERLKRQLDQLATQNEILRATSTPVKLPHQDAAQNQRANSASSSPKAVAAGTITNSSAAFNGAFSRPDAPISHRIQFSAQTGERLLATGAAWDLIQSHELYKKGLVDIGEVLDRLKEKVMCDGSGPSFAESDIINAVEQSVGIVGDELI